MNNRNPILSFIMSFFISGLGQLYNGEWKKALLFVFLIFPIYFIFGFAGFLSTFTGFVIHLIVLFGYKLYVAIDAYRSSKSLRPYALKKVNNLFLYLIFGIFSYGIIWYGVKLNRVLIGYDNFEIPTVSMSPTIQKGDRIMATAPRDAEIKRGDIVAFKREDGQSYLSRVLGLENETITIKDDQVFFSHGAEKLTMSEKNSDDQFEYQNFNVVLPNQRKYSIAKIEKAMGHDFRETETSNVENITVPKDHVYVISDNRNNGMDSRTYGPISIHKIDRIIRYIWWSSDFKRIGYTLDK